MTLIPRLKAIPYQLKDGSVALSRRAMERTHLEDADGSVAMLLQLLAEGRRTPAELATDLTHKGFPVSAPEIEAALSAFDQLGILEQSGGDDELPAEVRDRHQSNLRYYDIYADLSVTSADRQRDVSAARILLLGAGGAGSGILQSLVGLGVGHVTLVDIDVVETKNLARQFAYGLAAVGRRKVDAAKDWAEAYSGGTIVEAVHRRIEDADSIRELGAGADLVIGAIDSPDDVQLLINEACFELGVPFVSGGLFYSTFSYWSVDPGRSPCRLCLELGRDDQLVTPEGSTFAAGQLIKPGPVNRATGPVVQIMAGLMTMEAMRFLNRTDPPVALAAYQSIELADGMTVERHPWNRHPDCPLCERAEARPR